MGKVVHTLGRTEPVEAFLRECCDMEPGYITPVAELAARWSEWCQEHGRPDRNKQWFGRWLRLAVPGIYVRQFRRENGTLYRAYESIRLKPRGSAN